MTEGMWWTIVATFCLIALITTIALSASIALSTSSSSGVHQGCSAHQGFQRFINGVNNDPIQIICKDGAVVDL